MPGADEQIEYYEQDGTVRRRVTQDLGGGQRVITSDTEEHPDIKEFLDMHPDARIRGHHPETDVEAPAPGSFTLDELRGWVEQVGSVDVLLRMKRLDDRKTADKIYESRISEILAEDEDEDEEG